MEEVWKDIALSNLPPKLPSPPLLSLRHHTATAAAAVFHDFLAGNFQRRSPEPLVSPTLSLIHENQSNGFLTRKRCVIEEGCEERRWKKMMKNRESAARSRARKQAYTNELEMEIVHRVQENAALKRKKEELKMAIATQASSKWKLQRASSSPI